MKIKKKSKKEGFTIVELMVVIVIIGGLMGLLLSGLLDNKTDQKMAGLKLKSDPFSLKMALREFYNDCRRYPTTNEGLKILASNDLQDEGCPKSVYLSKKNALEDPWKRPYRYEYEEDSGYKIFTYGADNKEGGKRENKDIVLLEGH